jgi:integrase
LGKLGTVLNRYAEKFHTGHTYDFRPAIEELRAIAKAELHLMMETRAYADPEALIERIPDPLFQVTAGIQYEGGARIRGAALIRNAQLRGMRIDDIAGKEVGVIFLPSVSTKGGREREIFVSRNVYTDLCNLIAANNGELKIDHDRYRHELKKAAVATNQRYTGSHGLRHSFAQRRLQECLARGMGEVAAKLRVAHEMGHSRPAITELYLKKPG